MLIYLVYHVSPINSAIIIGSIRGEFIQFIGSHVIIEQGFNVSPCTSIELVLLAVVVTPLSDVVYSYYMYKRGDDIAYSYYMLMILCLLLLKLSVAA